MNIEKNVPIPKQRERSRWSELEVGDSVLLEGHDSRSNTYSTARVYGQRSGKKFTARTVDGGLRIWRIA